MKKYLRWIVVILSLFVLIIVVYISAMMLLVTYRADVDRRYKGLSINFNFTGPKYYTLMSALRSDKQEFDIDNVSLDLYYGWFVSDFGTETHHLVYYIIPYGKSGVIEPQEDYYNVENYYFITEELEFGPKEFAASQTRMKGKTFNHNKKITIPKEVFENQAGYFYLYAYIIEFSNEDNMYYFDPAHTEIIIIYYRIVDDNKVRLNGG